VERAILGELYFRPATKRSAARRIRGKPHARRLRTIALRQPGVILCARRPCHRPAPAGCHPARTTTTSSLCANQVSSCVRDVRIIALRQPGVILRAVAGSTHAEARSPGQLDPATPLRCAQDDGSVCAKQALVRTSEGLAARTTTRPPRCANRMSSCAHDDHVIALRQPGVILRAVAGSTHAEARSPGQVDPATPLRCAQDDGSMCANEGAGACTTPRQPTPRAARMPA